MRLFTVLFLLTACSQKDGEDTADTAEVVDTADTAEDTSSSDTGDTSVPVDTGDTAAE